MLTKFLLNHLLSFTTIVLSSSKIHLTTYNCALKFFYTVTDEQSYHPLPSLHVLTNVNYTLVLVPRSCRHQLIPPTSQFTHSTFTSPVL